METHTFIYFFRIFHELFDNFCASPVSACITGCVNDNGDASITGVNDTARSRLLDQ
jgi:hypothetical protein